MVVTYIVSRLCLFDSDIAPIVGAKDANGNDIARAVFVFDKCIVGLIAEIAEMERSLGSRDEFDADKWGFDDEYLGLDDVANG